MSCFTYCETFTENKRKRIKEIIKEKGVCYLVEIEMEHKVDGKGGYSGGCGWMLCRSPEEIWDAVDSIKEFYSLSEDDAKVWIDKKDIEEIPENQLVALIDTWGDDVETSGIVIKITDFDECARNIAGKSIQEQP